MKPSKPKILHVFSNHRWTGPAEPALTLIKNLRELGWDIDFICSVKGVPKNKYNRVYETALQENIPTLSSFYMSKHKHPIKDFLDRKNLVKWVQEKEYKIIHCHLDNDHRIATEVKTSQFLIRSNYYGEGLPEKMKKYVTKTHYILEPSRLAQKNDMEQFHRTDERCPIIPLAIDLQRFNPNRMLPKIKLNMPDNAIVLGIVARLQPHRKYHLLFSAIHSLIQEGWPLYLVIVGRGTRQDEVAFKPVKELELESQVIFTGYLNNDDYVAMLNILDICIYLVPGTDGTCRTVREYMAMGKPVITTKTGILPELVEHQKQGLIVNDTVEELYQAIRTLCEHEEYRKELGKNARNKAIQQFSPQYQAEKVSEIYENCLKI